MKKIKLFDVDFEGLWPVPSGLIIVAYDKESAKKLAEETLKVDDITNFTVKELIIDSDLKVNGAAVIYYASGDY